MELKKRSARGRPDAVAEHTATARQRTLLSVRSLLIVLISMLVAVTAGLSAGIVAGIGVLNATGAVGAVVIGVLAGLVAAVLAVATVAGFLFALDGRSLE